MGARASAVAGRFRSYELNQHADRLAAVHPRMADYVVQAPVIALATFEQLHAEQRRRLRDLCAAGVKLKAMMAALGLAHPLRVLPAHALRPGHVHPALLRAFAECHPSAIAQAIARNTSDLFEWLEWMWEWRMVCTRRGALMAPVFEWGVRRVDPEPKLDPAHMMDFIDRPTSAFKLNWTLAEFRAALARWEDTYTERDKLIDELLRGGVDPYQPLDYAPLPLAGEIDGLTFTALTTPLDIVEEGALMRHCAASYAARVHAGVSWLYSITRGDRRVATLGVIWSETAFAVEQVKERWNTDAPTEVLAAAERFVSDANAALCASEWRAAA